MNTNVEIYTWSTCPFSKKAKALLQARDISYIEHCIDDDDSAREAMANRANGGRTLPQVFINDRHIGGCDDLHIIDEIGTLEQMLYFRDSPLVDVSPKPQQLAQIEIYTWSNCPFSNRAKALLQSKGIEYTEYCIDGDDLAREAMTKRANGRHTLPQIFINDLSIGGCNNLHILEDIGSLDELLYSGDNSTEITKQATKLIV